MPKYPSITVTLPECAAWVRWWCGQEERRLLAANRVADPKQIRASMTLLSDALGRFFITAEDFAKLACKACEATGAKKSSIVTKQGQNLLKEPCPHCDGRGFKIPKEDTHGQTAPKLRLAGPSDAEADQAEEDGDEPATDGGPAPD